jgi:hypothetical protein
MTRAKERLRHTLTPFLSGHLQDWKGLPEVTTVELAELIGGPVSQSVARLGRAAAERVLFAPQDPRGDVAAYRRGGRVVLLEALHPVPAAVLDELPAPDAILPHEILDPGGYVHEYIYPARGLALSVLEPFVQGDARRIVRYRGFQLLPDVKAFQAEFYLPFEDQTYWAAPPPRPDGDRHDG